MSPFAGFPDGKLRLYSIPGQFFSDLLPEIDHIGELKLTLYFFWRLEQLEGDFRFLRREDFLEDSVFMQGLSRREREAPLILDEALERAVGRGTLLKALIGTERGKEACYFLNSERGRAAIEAIQEGKWRHAGADQQPVSVEIERPNIYRLYEAHIGPLNPMIAETLREVENTYSAEWIEEAIRIAVEKNIRKWRYVESILRSWKEKRRDEQDRKDTERDRRRYIEGEFADYIEH